MFQEFRSHKYQETIVYNDDNIKYDHGKWEWFVIGEGQRTGDEYRIILDEAPRENAFYVRDVRRQY